MLRAVPGHTASPDLAPLGHELAQRRDVLVVDVIDPVLAEDADLALLLLLPALVVLLAAGARLAAPVPSSTRHPAVSPPDRPRPRAPSPSRPSRSWTTRSSNARSSRPWRWPTSGSDRRRRPRSRSSTASRPPGSPR